MRAIAFILLTILVHPLLAHAKVAPERFAAIAVVEASGEVLHARHSEALRHPASLTKVMTLYLVFEAITAGDLGWDDRLRVSKKAARAHPSRLGVKANTTISVEEAVRAIVTKSANDVAIVLAERLGGGEARFARLMTKKARVLGMEHSRFVNASGLPDKRQVMTARDMAVLAYRIHHDFPNYYRFFSLSKLVWNDRDHNNHNTLLGRVEGVDGLKTGFTNASGYNIAVTAEREGKRLIVVVFGAASGAQRDAYATKLLERAFAELDHRRANETAPITPPLADLDDSAPVLVAGLATEAHQGAGERRGVQIIIDETTKTRPLRRPASTPAAPINPQQTQGVVTSAGQWGVQVGAFTTTAQAKARLHRINDIPIDYLGGNTGQIIHGAHNGAPLYRVRFLGLTPMSARAVCAELNAFGHSCFAVPPQSQIASK